MEKFHIIHMNITVNGIVVKFTHDPDMVFVFIPSCRRYTQTTDDGKMLLFQGIYEPETLLRILRSLPLLPCKLTVDLNIPYILEKTYVFEKKSFWNANLTPIKDSGFRYKLNTFCFEKTQCLNHLT